MRGVKAALELSQGDLVTAFGGSRDLDGHPTRQPDRLGVGGPVGRRHEHLVAGVEECLEGLEDSLLAAVGHNDLCGLDGITGVTSRFRRHCLPQLREARGRRVPVVFRVTACFHGRFHDVRRRREIGLSHPKADHVLARRLQRFGFGVNGKGGRFRDGGDAGRNASCRGFI